ncbi:CXXC-20-CXXC protein [Evansella vedderi]|uniref:CXXC-20-CXXC protein n=1 Tax=Evansella vedderi TaxID=38282 RepID=A0ABT9ZXJ1_9BACI|nr:TIGR04104 family putative zinc finger protein [Evansella vedderi]MDQ0254845.1 CXXC-20-CXXC protein [Evansella vedderi]
MPTCQNCLKEWSRIQTIKSSFTLDIGMKCPHCGHMQYLTKQARKMTFFVTIPIFFIFPVTNILNFSLIPTIITFIAGVLSILVICTYFVELSSEPEKRWFS